jgi:cytochrome c oxidase cbb3-type subunit III
MAVNERDPYTGYMTTGHEWNGIKELNSPVPRPVYFFLIVAGVFSVIYWILMPAWPLGVTYTKGLLGIDQRVTVSESLKQAALERGIWTGRIESESFKDIQADSRLMDMVRQTGRTLFGDNCLACHGSNAKGSKGFPNLTTASWLWGGDPENIAETIRVGVNSAHPQTRTSQMMAFGRDQISRRMKSTTSSPTCAASPTPLLARKFRQRKSMPARLFSPPTASPAMAMTARAKPISARRT